MIGVWEIPPCRSRLEDVKYLEWLPSGSLIG
jgi:hypothetical protein